MEAASRAPADWSASELTVFCDLVRAGGEVVETGLRKRVLMAHRIILAREGDLILGLAGLKHPDPGYKKSVFSKAGVVDADEYPFELGWVFVLPDHRGQGVAKLLVESALTDAGGRSVYATSRVDNTAMHRCLERYGFRRSGQPYRSRTSGREIWLFVLTRQPPRV